MSEALKAILRHKEFPRGKCWDEEDYSPGQTILREGESSSDLYLILTGVVRVNMAVDVTPGKRIESGLMEITRGDTFGELNL